MAEPKLASLLEEVRALAAAGKTKSQVGAQLGVSEASVRRFAAANGIEFGGVPAGESVTSTDSAEWGDIVALLERRGLDVQDWVIVGGRVNEWADQQQLRVDIKPRRDLLQPARADGWVRPPRPVPRSSTPRLVAFLGDHHAPNHDPALHAAVCEWLRQQRPDEGIILGDLLDLDSVSRHRANPEHATTLQECVDAGYRILRSYVEASPGTRWRMLAGNHEDRLRNAIIDQLRGIYGLTPGVAEGEAPGLCVHSVPFLLRLDELGIEYQDAGGEYAHGQIQVTPELAARHGWIAAKGSGSSALKTIDHLRYSVVVGHTHRQGIVHHTAHSIDGRPRTLLGAEAGTLAKVEGGLGYAVAPDWQQGFATATVWDDGRFKLDLATWVDGSLMWRDWRSA